MTFPNVIIANDRARPYKKQGLSALTKKIRLQGQAYFAKLTDETLSGIPPVGQDEFNDVTTHAALRAFCPAIAATRGFHLINANGQQIALIAAVPGETYDEEDDVEAVQLAPLVDSEWLQWIVLAEWVLGIGDRLMANLVFDVKTHRAGIIDATYGWQFQPTFLGWEDDEEVRTCYSFARELWEIQSSMLIFPRQLVFEAIGKEQQVLAALAPFPMPPHTLLMVQGHFAVLQRVFTEQVGDIPIGTIEQVAQHMVHYA